MAEPIFNRYKAVGPIAGDKIGTPGNINAYELDPNAKGYPDLGGTTPPTPTPTTPANPAGSVNLTESSVDKATREYYEGLSRTAPSAEDEARIREQTRANMQAQIDAVEASYRGLFQQEGLDATNRLGQTRAINARSGLIGSDFGAANTAGTVQQNARAMQALEAKKALDIAAINNKISDEAKAEVKAKREEALGNAKAYIDYLEKAATRTKDNVKSLAQSGASLEDLSADSYKKLLDKSGMDELSFKAYFNASKKAGEKTEYKYEVKNGKVVAYGVNPTTGKLDTISQDIPGYVPEHDGEYDQKITDNGQLLLIPKKLDPTKSLDQQVLTFGKAGQFNKPASGSGSGIVKMNKPKAIADAEEAIKASRGAGDNKADPGAYTTVRNTWVAQGGTTTEFDNLFRSYLSDAEKKSLDVGRTAAKQEDDF